MNNEIMLQQLSNAINISGIPEGFLSNCPMLQTVHLGGNNLTGRVFYVHESRHGDVDVNYPMCCTDLNELLEDKCL